MLGPALENNFCSCPYQKRRYSAALHNVAVIHPPVAAKLAALKPRLQKAAPEFLAPEPLVLLRQNYCGRGGGVSFGCFLFPPSGCPWPWP